MPTMTGQRFTLPNGRSEFSPLVRPFLVRRQDGTATIRRYGSLAAARRAAPVTASLFFETSPGLGSFIERGDGTGR